jgi:hypothetical protein
MSKKPRTRFPDRQAAFLLLLSGTIVCLHFLLHPVRVLGMDTSLFYLDEKYTLATFFSVTVSFLTGYLFLQHAPFAKTRLHRAANTAFAVFFLALSFDEMFEVHEFANTLIKQILGQTHVFGSLAHFSWIFPLAGLILLSFFLMAVKVRLSHPRVAGIILAGITCYGIVLVLELIGSASFGRPEYLIYVGLEEGMEMTGTALMFMAARTEAALLPA